jgi:hypothetical protein
MSDANLILTRVYLKPDQRAALVRKAREENTKISELIRRAVDVYIESEITCEELARLDSASVSAKADLDVILRDLSDINSTVRDLRDEVFALRARAARGEVV